MLSVTIVTLLIAFVFTFTNGFQDASSVAATFIASRSASPRQGILLIAGMNLLGAVFGGSAVAMTISGLLVLKPGDELTSILLVALITAAGWNVITWRYGLPSSSTHALIGGLAGGGIAAGGLSGVFWGVSAMLTPPHHLAGMVKLLIFLVLSVGIGFLGGYLMRGTTRLLLRNASRSVNRDLIRLNWVAACVMGFSNGANDAQKQMGIIGLALFAGGMTAGPEVPFWARLSCALLLSLGTVGGGWRIMTTLGSRIFKIDPIHSFDSQVSSGVTIALSTLAGAPISSTHVVATSIIGVGAAENPLKVRWAVGEQIFITMMMTIPVTLCLAALLYLVVSPFMGG